MKRLYLLVTSWSKGELCLASIWVSDLRQTHTYDLNIHLNTSYHEYVLSTLQPKHTNINTFTTTNSAVDRQWWKRLMSAKPPHMKAYSQHRLRKLRLRGLPQANITILRQKQIGQETNIRITSFSISCSCSFSIVKRAFLCMCHISLSTNRQTITLTRKKKKKAPQP